MMPDKIMPNFLIAGAAKSGTTSLYNYLKQHPDVYMSPIKEPNHFSTDINPADFSPEYIKHEEDKNLDVAKYVKGNMEEEHWEAYVHDKDQYQSLFRFAKNKKAIGEISNSYLYSTVAAKNIYSEDAKMKVIMILRNPVDRAYSHYLANVRDGKTILSFRDELENDANKTRKGWGISHVYYELGLYSQQVKRYLDVFPKEQLRIYFFDDLRTNSGEMIADLFRFINIDNDITIDLNEKHNEARVPKNKRLIHFLTQTGLKKKIFHLLPKGIQEPVKSMFFNKGGAPKLSKEDRDWLKEKYISDVKDLALLTKRDLSTWM